MRLFAGKPNKQSESFVDCSGVMKNVRNIWIQQDNVRALLEFSMMLAAGGSGEVVFGLEFVVGFVNWLIHIDAFHAELPHVR